MNFLTGALAVVGGQALRARSERHEADTPLERARERLARAEAHAKTLDEVERYGGMCAAVVGVAASLR